MKAANIRRIGVITFAVLLLASVLVLPILHFQNLVTMKNASFLLYAVTAFAVVAYTLVNWLLVKEVQAQREIQIRPFIVVIFNNEDSPFGVFELLNVGNAVALNVKINQIYEIGQKDKPQIDIHYVAIPHTIALMPPNKPIRLQFQLTSGDVTLLDPERGAPLEPSFAKTQFLIEGSFQNIEGRRYHFRVETGNKGLRILT